MTVALEVRRIYDDPKGKRTEYRALVDRLWPRGVSKDSVHLDEWAKDLAPSTALRRWYGHDPERFREFSRRYRTELKKPPASAAVEALIEASAGRRALVLLTATRDVERSGATVLAGHLQSVLPGS